VEAPDAALGGGAAEPGRTQPADDGPYLTGRGACPDPASRCWRGDARGRDRSRVNVK
jgi:hypothetical protein